MINISTTISENLLRCLPLTILVFTRFIQLPYSFAYILFAALYITNKYFYLLI